MAIRRFSPVIFAGLIVLFIFSFTAFAVDRTGWQTKEVDFRAGSGRRIKAIHYPAEKKLLTRADKKAQKLSAAEIDSSPLAPAPSQSTSPVVSVNVIDSPPINGFIPWIAVSATDESMGDEDYNAYRELSPVGSYFPVNPQTDFAIGLFDTGASTHVMGYQASQVLNLNPGGGMETGNYIEIAGVTGSVDAWVSRPLALFIAGLNAIDPVAMILDTSALVGQSNIAIAVGEVPEPNAPDLPTAIGSPMSVYYTAVFRNDREVTVHYGGKNYTAPEIQMYPNDSEDPGIPDYSIDVPLELRPGGAAAVSYIPTIDFYSFEMLPSSPSIIIGNLSQSLFFVHAVDLNDNGNIAYDKDRFMIDTGAQVTVIGTRIAARLGIDPANPEFIVDIEGVSGEVSEVGGYYIDQIEIPALGEWLNFTNVPVILLDIASPEGGTLDGIIGMNLFNEYNMVFRGGGMFLQDDPVLELELITAPSATLAGDIAPEPLDGIVDIKDLSKMADCWLASFGDGNFDAKCDIAPSSITDGKVDFQDFAVIAQNWLRTITP